VPKLKLEIDELKVESFAVLPHSPATAGTVHGRFNNDWNTLVECEGGGGGSGVNTQGTCIGPTYCCQPTWQQTCMPTCPNTCDSCLINWCSLIC